MNCTLFRSVRTLLFCLILNSLHGQTTTITDSLRTKNPLWFGDTAWMNFTSQGLRTNAPGAGSLSWSLPSKAAINAQWQLNITLDFNPSSSNFCEVQFIDGPKGQYVLQLSGKSTDDLSLILRRPGHNDSTLTSLPGYLNQSKPELALKILRDSSYTFWVYDADSLLLSTTDSTLRSAQKLTLFCKYTSSRVDKFLFSTLHISGHIYKDTIAARLLQIQQKSPTTIALSFNEPCIPSPSALNGLIAYQQGIPIDTAHYPQLFEKNWFCTFSSPLPLGPIAFEIQNTVDSALNPSGPLWEFLTIQYTPEQTVALTAVQPFDHATTNFVRIYSPHALTANLHSVDLSGKTQSQTCVLDSGYTHLSNLHDLPRAGALWIEKDGIVLGHAIYDDLFNPSIANGYHALFRDTVGDLRGGWQVRPAGQAQIHPPHWDTARSANRINNIFLSTNQELWVEWNESWYSDPERPRSWQPDQPLMVKLKHVPEDSLKSLGLSVNSKILEPDSGGVVINEVHFAPSELEEFIEVANTTGQPIATERLWVSLYQHGRLIRSERLDVRQPTFASEPYSAVLLPEEILALPAPFSLPNDTCKIVLHTIEGDVFDQMSYWPLKKPHEHRSFERVALTVSGNDLLNWHYHIPALGQESEGSPNERNSVAGALPTLLAEVELERNWVSFDPMNYQPTTVLWVGAEAGERVWAEVRDGSGRIVKVLLAGVEVGVGKDGMGRHSVVIAPQEWGWTKVRSGIFWIHCMVGEGFVWRKKLVPISIFNP